MKYILLILQLVLISQNCLALDRCDQYKIEVKNSCMRILGPQWPWHYNLAQLNQESSCRANITAFDGGQGISQFMAGTMKNMERKYHTSFNPYDPKDGIRMQSLYMYELHQMNNFPNKPLFLTYQMYNGGLFLLEKEYLRSINKGGNTKLNQCIISPDWDLMKQQCRRKIILLKGGKSLDLCEVNYSYPKKIYKGGNLYRTLPDAISYW